MQNPVSNITIGRGGDGVYGGIGGRAGDVHFHYGSPGPSDTFLLMDLPRALYASHNSVRKDTLSSCLEGTRVDILKEILSWSESANGERTPVYWLSGLAGLGKSTIAKTVAERAQKRAMLGASFFFSRSDERLRDPGLVLPTLAFQLAQSDGVFKEVIVKALRQDPTVGRQELSSQLQELILKPLRNINPHRPPVLIVLDALDECEEGGAASILQLVFADLIQIPFLRILITSRPQPRLSLVFNKVPNLAKTVLHDIDALVIEQDIHLYISTQLAKIPGKLGLAMPADWATEAEMNSLVEKSGKLFVYAATAIRFIEDDRMQDPRSHLRLILDTHSLRQSRVTPYSQLDELYMGVLRNSLSAYNHQEIVERFQIVVGSIVLLREPLPLHSLANFVRYETQAVEASLRHLHSVIVPPSDIQEAPRIYHPSFIEFITDASRCSMPEFVIVPVPGQELRHVIRCFELMATHLKRDVAGISDPSLLNEEVDGFEEKVREALSPEVQYACRYWASHLSRVEFGEKRVMEALESFSMQSILWWLEALSLIGGVSTAVSSIQEAHRWAKSSKCKLMAIRILSDSHRFILAHGEVIRASALHMYHSALPFTPRNTALYREYCKDGEDCVQVLQGMEPEWPQNLSTFGGHSGWVNTVAFSPDGLRLASGSDDHTVRLWDAISGVSIAKLEGHSGWVSTVAFSPNGLCLASGCDDHTVRLWDAVSGASIAKLKGHLGWVTTMAFSPNGSQLASGSSDCTVQLWDTMSGVSISKLKGHSHWVTTIAFSPDGLSLASGTSDGSLHFWNVLSGAPIAKLEGHSGWVRTVAFSPDGLSLASGSNDHTLQLWDARSHTSIARLKGHSRSVRTVAFSSNGLHHLASGSDDRTVQLWDARSGASIAKLEGHSGSVGTVAFSPNGTILASGSDDYTLRLWDATSGVPIAKLEGHSDWVSAIAFSPDGLHLASGSNDHTLRLWDAISGPSIGKLESHSNWVRTIAFSPDGLHLASGSDDCTLRLWDALSGASIAKLEGHSDWIRTISFSPDGLCLASGSDDDTVRLWDAVSGASLAKLEGHSGSVTAVEYSLDGHTLISHSGVEIIAWNLTSQPPSRLASISSLATPTPFVTLTPLIWSWSPHDRWIEVRRKHGYTRRVCYIPTHFTPSTKIIMSSHQTHPRIAVGCTGGRVIILAVPLDPFD